MGKDQNVEKRPVLHISNEKEKKKRKYVKTKETKNKNNKQYTKNQRN